MVVLPARRLGERHEDGFDAAAGLQPEDGTAVVHQVELDVPAAAHQLPLLLLLRVLGVLALLHDWDVRGDDGVGAGLGKGKVFVGCFVVLVVEEDAAEAARLAAVRDLEVVVCPLFKLWVVLRVMLVADALVSPVEVRHVVLEEVRGRDVRPAAEPPDAAVRLEVAVVEMHRRGHRVARVHHRRNAAGEERNLLARRVALGAVRAARRRRLQRLLRHGAIYHGDRHARLLKDFAVLHHARNAAAAVLAQPRVLLERRAAVELFDGCGNAVLRRADHLLEAAPHRLVALDALHHRLRRRRRGHVVVPRRRALRGRRRRCRRRGVTATCARPPARSCYRRSIRSCLSTRSRKSSSCARRSTFWSRRSPS
mmetsp:Transcript_1038/g.3831  ORF Transcript_1038/g.3831 Transcript_1038/m.3831 type:complete len:367 (-) Transcript_1038:175-1275(-)